MRGRHFGALGLFLAGAHSRVDPRASTVDAPTVDAEGRYRPARYRGSRR